MRRRTAVFLPLAAAGIVACMARVPGGGLGPVETPQALEIEALAEGPGVRVPAGAAAGILVLNIRWPRGIQAIPASTRVIRAEVHSAGALLKNADGEFLAVEVPRPIGEATSSARLEVPPGGPYDLLVGAYDDDLIRLAGTLVASGSATFSIRSNERLSLKLALRPKAVATPTPSPTPTPAETPAPLPTPVPIPSEHVETPTPAPTPSPTPTPDALPTLGPTPTPAPTPTPTPMPAETPSFASIYLAPANTFTLYLAASDGNNTAGYPTSLQLQAMDFATDASLSASLFTWTSSAPSVATVSANGLVTALSSTSTEVTIQAAARHNSAIKSDAMVRVKASGRVDLEIN